VTISEHLREETAAAASPGSLVADRSLKPNFVQSVLLMSVPAAEAPIDMPMPSRDAQRQLARLTDVRRGLRSVYIARSACAAVDVR